MNEIDQERYGTTDMAHEYEYMLYTRISGGTTSENKDVTFPSIIISDDEYQVLKTDGECAKLKIIRTRRGMIWRKFDRTKYESEHKNQYDKCS